MKKDNITASQTSNQKEKTAICQAIDVLKLIMLETNSSSQQIGLAKAMDCLEDFKIIEKNQMKIIYIEGKMLGSIGSEDFFNKKFTQE